MFMFIIELTYKASLAEIDASMAAHVIFLKKYYAAGNFLISGRQIPRRGESSWRWARVDSKSKSSSVKTRSTSAGSPTSVSSSFERANGQTIFKN